MKLDPIEYKNGQKNNWRRTMWNLLRRITQHPGDALVLYLPGAANMDLPVALEKGFDRRNMIAIERDKRVAEFIRHEYRQTVIDADLTDVLLSWPANHPPKIVIADLVHGLTRSVYGLFEAWALNAAFRRCHLVVNMMRGRETDNCFVGLAKDWFSSAAGQSGLSTKSRTLHGILAYNFVVARALTMHWAPDERIAKLSQLWRWLMTTPPERNLHAACGLPSYKSTSGQVFDSFVVHDRDVWTSLLGKQRSTFPELVSAHGDEDRERFAAINRRIVAAMAVRTMRFNGQLPCRA